MSMARREAKWRIDSLRCAGQYRPPLQRHAASSSSRTSAEPHCGHSFGIFHGRAEINATAIVELSAPGKVPIIAPLLRSTARSLALLTPLPVSEIKIDAAPPPGVAERELFHDFAGRVTRERTLAGHRVLYLYDRNETHFYDPDAAEVIFQWLLPQLPAS